MSSAPESHKVAKDTRLPVVDLARLAAALMVVFFHFGFRGAHGGPGDPVMSPASFPALAPVVKYFYMGVDWFFMISGLVISYSARGRTASQFCFARASRLLPGYITCTVLIGLFLAAFPSPLFPVSVPMVLANFTFFPKWFKEPFISGSFWSLPVEITFYVWVCLLIKWRAWGKTLTVVAWWLGLSCLLLIPALSGAADVVMADYAGAFCVGILVYHMLDQGFSWKAVALLVVALGQECAARLIQARGLVGFYGTDFQPAVVVGMVLLMTLGLYGAAIAKVPARWMGVCAFLGGLTFPLYLVHEFPGYRLFQLLHERVSNEMAFAVILSIFLVVSAFVWLAVEKPCIPWLRRLLTARYQSYKARRLARATG